MRAATTRIAALAALLLLQASMAFAQLPPVTHAYALNKSYKDRIPGGPEIAPLGGYLANGSYVITDQNGGLYLPPKTVPKVYSIDMRVTPTKVDGYRKLIDFKNKTSDAGLYIRDGGVVLYPTIFRLDGAFFVANKPAEVLMTRNATGMVAVYVNGTPLITYDDSSAMYFVFSAAGEATAAHFLVDDVVTGGVEFTTANVTHIRLFNKALTKHQAKLLASGVKPPNVVRN